MNGHVGHVSDLVPMLAAAYLLVLAGVAVSIWWQWHRWSGRQRRRRAVPPVGTGHRGAVGGAVGGVG